MGNLSNLYISQSFQSLIHLGTNNTASANLIDLQDGLGNSIGVAVNTNGDLFLSGSLTASLQQGYVLVGNASGRTTTVATSSFIDTFVSGNLVTTASFNAYTSSANNRLNNLESTSASVNISISNINSTTASQAVSISNLNTFSQSANTQLTNLSTSQSIDNTKWNTLGGQTGSYVTSAITASSLVTASVSLNTITFTKGDASTFNIIVNTGSAVTDITSLNAFTASQETKDTTLASVTSSLNSATASLFTSTSLALITASAVGNTITFTKGDTSTFAVSVSSTPIDTGSLVTTASFNAYTQSNDQRVNSLEVNSASVNVSISNINTFTQSAQISINALNTNSASVNTSITNINSATASLFASASLSLITASFSGNTLTFTKGDTTTFGVVIPDVSGSTINTGSFATTGSNSFTGIQTFVDGTNFSSLVPTSGSLMLVAKSFTSTSLHLTSSFTNSVNLIFKSNSNTADTIISGSNNIFTNPTAASAGLKRYFGGSGNIAMSPAATPQISGSMGFSPTMNVNFFGGTSGVIMRGPVSSSVWTISSNNIQGGVNIGNNATQHAQGIVAGLTMNTNSILGNVAIVANRTNTSQLVSITTNQLLGGTTTLNMNSSSVVMQNNLIGGTNTINNNTTGSSRVSPAGNAFNFAQNIMMGGNTITASGSNDPNDTQDLDYNANIYRSFILGNSNTIQLQSGITGSNSMVATSVLGNNLIVTGSSPNPQFATSTSNAFGSAFFGRFNALDGNKAQSAQTIFAVGTGTSTSARKTGFLIDSGSNSYFEGTLNVSGSTSFTGSLTATGTFTASLTQGYAWVGNASNISTLVATSSFGGALPAGVLSSSVTNFVDYSASVDSRINGIVTGTGFATTGSNTFTGNQIITGSMFVYDAGSGNRAEIMNGQISRFPQLYAQTLFPGQIVDDNGTNLLIKTNAGGATNGGYLIVNTVSGSQFTGSLYIQ